jgi:methionyl-tRNA formyltransferase
MKSNARLAPNNNKSRQVRFAFFGTAPLSGGVLGALEGVGLLPALVVAGADSKDIRTKEIVVPPEKIWALSRSIPVIQPEKIDVDFIASLSKESWDVFVVASYGKILPKKLLDIPRRGTINIHPSLLPRLRGPSPIRSAILNDERATGVSIMLLDEKMDHGPLIAQKKVMVEPWPPHGTELDALLAREGGELLVTILPEWIEGKVEAQAQNHDIATICSIFSKEDGFIDLATDPYKNLLKIRAYEGWPGTFTYFEKGGKKIRVKIIDAHIHNSALIIDRVVPEGKKEMPYEDFLRSGARPIST